MWILEFLFLSMTLLIGWTLFGYFLFVWFVSNFKNIPEIEWPEKLPKISLIVPCYNEEKTILDKIKDIERLEYPRELLEIVFVDGGSTDNTVNILRSNTKDEYVKILISPKNGKINQLNYAFSKISGEIIVNTDVDSLLSRHSLKWIAAEFNVSNEVAVVGAYCRPSKTLEIEKYYWAAQNKSRFMENDAWASSIVVAPCYAFKRTLLSSFPDDVVADDVYIAYLANTLGYKTVYSRHAMVMETRNPEKYRQFISQKFRKSNAFVKESLRFIYRLPEMSYYCKLMSITKLFQQIFLPWAMLFWIMLAGSLITMFRLDMVIFCLFFLFVLFFLTSFVFSRIKLPDLQHKYSLRTLMQVYIITNIIMFATGISYPFYKQNSSYKKIEIK